MLNADSAPSLLLACGFRYRRLATLAAVVILLTLFSRPALANPEAQVLLNLTLSGGMTEEEVIARAESMANSEISDRFTSNPSLTAIEITVLGNRNGDVIPIVMTSVSRADWQANPSISAWSNYYRSYALFQRHSEPPAQVAATYPRQSPGSANRVPGRFDRGGSVASALDAGILPGRTLQANLDEID